MYLYGKTSVKENTIICRYVLYFSHGNSVFALGFMVILESSLYIADFV